MDYQAGGYPGAGYRDDAATGALAEPVPEAPAEDEPDDDEDLADRDRFAVHWIWEGVLLAGVIALGALLWQARPGALGSGELQLLLVLAAGFGLLGLGAGVTLRAGAPNLAIGPVALAAGAYFADRGDAGVVPALVAGLAAAVMLGAVIAVLVVVFHVPGWAASLAAAAAAVVWLQLQPETIPLAGTYSPGGQAAFLFALVAALGVLGGLFGTLHGVRSAVGRFRSVGDPAQRSGPLAALLTGGAILLSMAFAAVAGVLLVAGYGEAVGPGNPVEARSGVTWLAWTAVGFAVALIGGTSAYGRRGGVFGTTLAVVALVLFQRYQAEQGWEIALLATAAAAVVFGLVVTRLVETFGRPRPVDPGGSSAGRHAGASRWSGHGGAEHEPENSGTWVGGGRDGREAASAADSWSSALPARPAPGVGDPWDDERWRR